MQCTSCEQGQLVGSHLAPLLPTKSCSHCGGHFFYLADYLRWLEQAPKPTAIDSEIEANETNKAMLCPVSGRLMRKYRITHTQPHKVDLSTSVNGIWLDKGEWELLEQEGLSLVLNKIFTDPWQRNIRLGKTSEVLKAQYQAKFGDQTYQKMQALRQEIHDSEQKAELLAYLVAEDPYSVT
ncbi:zf-TFIIB domain-containing protein [Motilimonas pumila]|uniref:zf-TFIIB domain-containing protein n=1 Tax=Motilimonas pumila TaxID=2303987 RepID=UPI0013140F6B|nr:zf-TFIIB domain-containing protein [Motilimonas pumila]